MCILCLLQRLGRPSKRTKEFTEVLDVMLHMASSSERASWNKNRVGGKPGEPNRGGPLKTLSTAFTESKARNKLTIQLAEMWERGEVFKTQMKGGSRRVGQSGTVHIDTTTGLPAIKRFDFKDMGVFSKMDNSDVIELLQEVVNGLKTWDEVKIVGFLFL